MALGSLHHSMFLVLGFMSFTQACGVAALKSGVLAHDRYTTHQNFQRASATINPLGYIASNTPTAIALTLVLLVAFTQTYCMRKWGPKWMLSLLIGEYCFAVGFALRFAVHAQPDSILIYAVDNLFIILSPCGFIAADYVLLGRLAIHLDSDKHLVVPAQKITKYFVISDVVTFLVQMAGGGLSASGSSMGVTGSRIFLVGLILQLLSFTAFIIVFGAFMRSVKNDLQVWNRDRSEAWYNDWRALAGALGVNCVGIMVRSFYRVIEMSQGYRGHLSTTEAYFYCLDTVPLFIAIVIYTPFWPGRFIARTYRYSDEISLGPAMRLTHGASTPDLQFKPHQNLS